MFTLSCIAAKVDADGSMQYTTAGGANADSTSAACGGCGHSGLGH